MPPTPRTRLPRFRPVWPWLAALVAIHIPVVLADACAPHPPAVQYRDAAAQPPGGAFPLGTDDLGRDVTSRMLHGTRVSLATALTATVVALSIAVIVGALGALGGGTTDAALTLLTELTLAVPWLFLLLSLRAALPLDLSPTAAFGIVALLLGAVGWGGSARLIRGTVQQALHAGYVDAAVSSGATPGHIFCRHLWPDLLPVVVGQAALLLPRFVLAEVTLSFLGLGMPEPVPSLGTLIGELRSTQVLITQPWRLAPLVMLFVVTMGYNEVWERLREEARSGDYR